MYLSLFPLLKWVCDGYRERLGGEAAVVGWVLGWQVTTAPISVSSVQSVLHSEIRSGISRCTRRQVATGSVVIWLSKSIHLLWYQEYQFRNHMKTLRGWQVTENVLFGNLVSCVLFGEILNIRSKSTRILYNIWNIALLKPMIIDISHKDCNEANLLETHCK